MLGKIRSLQSGETQDDEVRGPEWCALRKAALFENIIDSLSETVLVVGRTGNIIFANKSQRAHLNGERHPTTQEGYEAGYAIFSADGTRQLPFSEWPISRALRGDFIDSIELKSRLADGREGIFLLSSRPLLDDRGRSEGAIIVTRDITAMRRTEEELRHSQKLETIGQLTGGIAHDFNNMLAAILNASEVLQRGVSGNERLERAAAMVEKAALRGADLTRHLLAFARRQTLSPVALDLAGLLDDALMLIRPALGATIEIEVEALPGVYAFVDPAQLTSALLNLCVNARDAMAPNGGRLTLKVCEQDGFAQIDVIDSGCGMSAETLSRAVEPFFTTKDVGKGSGLGLSMVYGFAQQSGGDLRIESKVGVGTHVRLRVPKSIAPAPAVAAAAPMTLPRTPLSVLVVDDDSLVREALCLQLGDAGFSTISAPDGHAALAMLDEGATFDVLLTDMVMPRGMTGLALAEEVRARRPDVRVIISTGYVEQDLPDQGPNWLLLRKPYTSSKLFATLRSVVLQTN